MQTHIISAPWNEYKSALMEIRKEVFVVEQGVPPELEPDVHDDYSNHFLAINEIGQHIGCARLMQSGQIGRMAVTKELRGSGVGEKLLEAAVEKAKELSLSRVFLHAQSYTENFYRKGGFLPFGKPFEEAGISHIAMEMKLPLTFPQSADGPAKQPIVSQQNSKAAHASTSSATQPPIAFKGLVESRRTLQDVVACAKRRLLILNPHLDHLLFDYNEVVAALSKFARSAAGVEVSILIMDSKLIVERGHQVLELARRLDEKIHIRKLNESVNAKTSSFVCADFDSYWLMPNYNAYEGVLDLANPVTNKRLAEVFVTAWEKSFADPELRVLQI